MSEKDYYPAGSYNDPQAPWNDDTPDPKEFDVTISQTLSKSTTVITDDYVLEWEELDPEDGGTVPYYYTHDTDWDKAYSEGHYTPLELIKKLKEILENPSSLPAIWTSQGQYLIKECSNWIEDETEIVEE